MQRHVYSNYDSQSFNSDNLPELLYIDIPCEEELILLGGKESSSYLYIIQCQKSEFKVEIAYGNLTNNSQMSH